MKINKLFEKKNCLEKCIISSLLLDGRYMNKISIFFLYEPW